MVNKKGDGHVDWIISIGIFLIFLLSIFVIFRPGIQPSQNYNTLLDILSDKIKQDYRAYDSNANPPDFGGFYWTLYRIPLFFTDPIFKDGMSKKCIPLNFPYNENNLISQDRLNVLKIKNDGTTSYLKRKLDGNKLYVEEEISWDLNSQYIIYFSDNEFYSGKGESGDILDITDCEQDSNNINYNLGIIEKTRGVANEILNMLSNNDKQIYSTLKTIYGYPKSKEFSITITEGAKEYKYIILIPDAKANIYTREWGDFILGYDGTRIPININLKVW